MPKKSWSAGAKKAYAAMVSRYGASRGKSIFYAKANKVAGGGKSKSPGQKASSVFKKGGSQKARKKT